MLYNICATDGMQKEHGDPALDVGDSIIDCNHSAWLLLFSIPIINIEMKLSEKFVFVKYLIFVIIIAS